MKKSTPTTFKKPLNEKIVSKNKNIATKNKKKEVTKPMTSIKNIIIELNNNYYERLLKNNIAPLANELHTLTDIIKSTIKTSANTFDNSHDILKFVRNNYKDYNEYIQKRKMSANVQWETLHNTIVILCGAKKPWKSIFKNSISFAEKENFLLKCFIKHDA